MRKTKIVGNHESFFFGIMHLFHSWHPWGAMMTSKLTFFSLWHLEIFSISLKNQKSKFGYILQLVSPLKSNSKNILFYSIFWCDAPLRPYGPVKIIKKSLWGLGVVLYVWCGVMGGGAREGMHFSQSKNARLLNLFRADYLSAKNICPVHPGMTQGST